MKTPILNTQPLLCAFVLLAVTASGGILSGPVVNPANEHTYYLLTQNTWTGAEAEAIALGGHLATINDATENQWITSTFGAPYYHLWIGLNDAALNGDFVWSSGQPVTYLNWFPGEPNHFGTEHYVHIYNFDSGQRQWNNYSNLVYFFANNSADPIYGIAEISAGVLSVTLNPAAAVSAGAQWRVDGGAWQNSGAIVANLAAGDHTVSFNPVSGWITPSNQTVAVTAGATKNLTISYVANVGALQVTINPPGAVSAGAQWRVDGGAWQNSGAVVTNLFAGNHTVSFKIVTGWVTPGDQVLAVTFNATNSGSASYLANVGALQVTLNPAGAVSAGAQWQVDGGALQNSGAVVTSLSLGNHTVSFKTITGWMTPSDQTVTVAFNTTNTASASYIANAGALQVTLNPAAAVSAGAQWQVDGGGFQSSGAVAANLSVGSHTVSFKTITGWLTPSNQTVTVAFNTTNTASASYIANIGALQMTISPAEAASAGAQWRVDGGAWQNSGAVVTNLSAGTHTASFNTVSRWLTPGNRTVTVTYKTTNNATATYLPNIGSLQVTINPMCAVVDGAQWQLDGGAWQNSGAIVTNLAGGNHTVSFSTITNWITPGNQAGLVTANRTNTTAGRYMKASTPGTITWVNAGGPNANWSAATNWDLGRAPTNGDIVLIPNTGGDACILDVNATVAGLLIGECAGGGSAGLNLNGNTLEVDGPITVVSNAILTNNASTLIGNSNTVISGVVNLIGGTLGGSFTLDTNATLLLTDNVHAMGNCVLTNNGTVAWSGADIWGGGTLGTVIYNNGLWEALGDSAFYGAYGGNSIVFNNAGTFRKSAGTGQTVFGYNGVFLNNTGVLDAQTGVIVLASGGNLIGGTATNLGGIVQLASGTFNVNGTLTTTNVQMVGGSLTGTNVFTNGFSWSGGDWSAASPVTITPGTRLLLAGATHVMGNTILTNNGTVAWSGGEIWGGGTPGTVIYNNGLWDSQGDSGFYGAYGGNSIVFNNAGTFRKSAGTGQTFFGYNGVFVNNTGILDAQTGVIMLAAGGNFTGGTLNFGLSSATNYGQISYSGSMPLAGTVRANLKNGFIPATGNSFSVLSYESETGNFTSTVLPLGFTWTTSYGSTAYTISVASTLPSGSVTNLVSKWQSGQALLQFSGTADASYTVLATTDLSLPRTNWNALGQASQLTGSIFQYLDNQIPSYPQRFYQIRSP